MGRLACVLLGAAVVWAACGGDVVVDDPPEGSGASGSGASGASGANGSGPSSGSGAASSSATGTGAVGGGSPGSPCEGACNAIASCTAVDCLGGCLSADPRCFFAFEPFLDCIAMQTDPATCDLPLDCAPLLESWLDCESWCLQNEFGCFVGDDGTCGCTAIADCGPVSTYETSCQPVGGDTRSCDCIADGVTMGRCTDEPTTACDPFLGCCATVFFVPGGSG